MFIGIIILNTLQNTLYVKVPVTSKEVGLTRLKQFSDKYYKGKVVDFNILSTDDLDTI